MYAALIKLRIDPARAPEAAQAFTGQILPRVTDAEGFKGGYWVDPKDGEGFGMALFDTEDQARGVADPATWDAPGVTVDSIDVRRVAVAI